MESNLENPIETYENSYFSRKSDILHKSFNLGNRLPNPRHMVSFDDATLFRGVPNLQVSEIFLYSNQISIFGFKVIYYNPETKKYYAGADFKVDASYKIEYIIPKSIKLNEDDCVVEITVRNGDVVDYIKFQTKKGLILEEGNPNGGDFVKTVRSQNDHYFSNFGGSLHTIWGCLLAIHFEEITLKQPSIKCQGKINFQTYRLVLRMIVNYLSFKDCVKIFLLNSHLYTLRSDPLCFRYLTESALKSLNNQHRTYIKNILNKKIQMEEDGQMKDDSFKYAISLIRMTSNKIKNAYGQLEWQDWQKSNNGFAIETALTQSYRTHCFAGNLSMSEVFQEFVLNKIFDEEFMQGLIKGTKVILAGGNLARRCECPSFGFIELVIFDEKREVIFTEKINKENMIPEYQTVYIRYQVENGKIPQKLKFTFGGRDMEEWKGNYGPRFSGLFIRGYEAKF